MPNNPCVSPPLTSNDPLVVMVVVVVKVVVVVVVDVETAIVVVVVVVEAAIVVVVVVVVAAIVVVVVIISFGKFGEQIQGRCEGNLKGTPEEMQGTSVRMWEMWGHLQHILGIPRLLQTKERSSVTVQSLEL